MFRSLRGRLWLVILITSLVPLGALLAAGILLAERNVESADLQAVVRANRLIAGILDRWGASTGAERQAIVDAVSSIGRTLYVAPMGDTAFVIDPTAAQRAERGLETYGKIAKGGKSYLYSVMPIGDSMASILLREYDSPQYHWSAWAATLGIAAALAAVMAVVASLIFSRDILRPVERVSAAIHEVAAGEQPTPFRLEGPVELQSLAESFNTMSMQLDEARAAERDFLLSVTHELKTPVAAVRGYAEGQRDGIVEPEEAQTVILAEVGRLERLVQDLLDLARLSRRRFSVRHEALDLGTIARAAAASCEPQARELGVRVEVAGEEAAPALADHDRAVQVVRNLIENSMRCSPPGAAVRVSVRPGQLEVTDAGPGLKALELKHAFDRFFLYRRYRGRRPVGTGLGLAIVKELVEAMHGSVAVSSGPDGGATFTVRLPLPSEAAEPPAVPPAAPPLTLAAGAPAGRLTR
jgi:two-component system OmpR family sensor kinase